MSQKIEWVKIKLFLFKNKQYKLRKNINSEFLYYKENNSSLSNNRKME